LTLYLDTSLLVSALTAETDGQRVEAWLRAQINEDIAVSDWVVTEFSAALSMKVRNRQIDEARRAEALRAFSQFCINNASVFTIQREQFRTAALFSDRFALGLRAGDALHLAICLEYGATLCTLDRQQSDAGPYLGVQTLLV
jgi:uncharacterized protein